MSREDVATALDKAAEALAEAAHALRGIEPDAARASVPEAGGASAASPQRSPVPAATSALGVCPVHRKPWSVKEGGVSKNGNSYPAFWKCSEKDGDAWCNEKPDKAWVKTHPPERALVADDDLPF